MSASTVPPRPRRSRMAPRRAMVLIGVHVVIAAHLVQWQLTGSTLSPVEPSEAMQTLEAGRVNAGFLFFLAAILSTFVLGRLFCGWGCHVVALQDLCATLLRRMGIRLRPFRSRLLAFIPIGLALYMFVWPTLRRVAVVPLLDRVWPAAANALGRPEAFPGFSNHLVEADFWQTFPQVAVAIPFLLVCGFAAVVFLGQKGFCTYGCPYGGVFGPVDRLATGRIVADLDACQKCGHCTATCTSNVRVHEEIQVHRMVVDTGCMKCMDCVSVCPNDALSFRLTRPPLLRRDRPDETAARRRPARRYDTSLRADVALLGVFLVAFLGTRGAYGLVPMLMAVGVAITAMFLAWRLATLRTSPEIRLHGWVLRTGGRLTGRGRVFVGVALVALLLVGHTAGLNAARARGEALDADIRLPRNVVLDAPPGSLDPEVRDRATRARDLLALTRPVSDGGLGLVATPGLDLRVAWLDLVRGRPDLARPVLEAELARGTPTDALVVDLARVMRLEGREDRAVAMLEASLDRNPDLDRARGLLAGLLLDAGRPDAAIELLQRAVVRAPGDAIRHHDLAIALREAGRTGAALRSMTRAAELRPDDPRIRSTLDAWRRELGVTPGRRLVP